MAKGAASAVVLVVALGAPAAVHSLSPLVSEVGEFAFLWTAAPDGTLSGQLWDPVSKRVVAELPQRTLMGSRPVISPSGRTVCVFEWRAHPSDHRRFIAIYHLPDLTPVAEWPVAEAAIEAIWLEDGLICYTGRPAGDGPEGPIGGFRLDTHTGKSYRLEVPGTLSGRLWFANGDLWCESLDLQLFPLKGGPTAAFPGVHSPDCIAEVTSDGAVLVMRAPKIACVPFALALWRREFRRALARRAAVPIRLEVRELRSGAVVWKGPYAITHSAVICGSKVASCEELPSGYGIYEYDLQTRGRQRCPRSSQAIRLCGRVSGGWLGLTGSNTPVHITPGELTVLKDLSA